MSKEMFCEWGEADTLKPSSRRMRLSKAAKPISAMVEAKSDITVFGVGAYIVHENGAVESLDMRDVIQPNPDTLPEHPSD